MDARHAIEGLIAEVAQNELVWLAKELQLTDEQKRDDAARHLAHELPEWAADNGVTLAPNAEDEPFDALEELAKRDPESFTAFGAHAMREVEHGRGDAHELPWTAMDFRGYVLVHFSDASSIHGSGFKFGVDPSDRHRIALTTNYSDGVRKRGKGFNFAFRAADAKRYAYSRGSEPKYGTSAVMFRANGIRVWHHGDEEPQVIFLGDTAHDIVYLYQHDGWCVGERPSGNPIFRADDIDEVIDWVTVNYDQYHKTLRR